VFPHEHLFVALLPVIAYVAVRDRTLPSVTVIAVTALGSQFPDLVDKPLAHQFGLLPSGRVFTHSLPIAIPLVIAVLAYGWRTGRRRLAGAFVSAYLLHLVGDTYTVLLTGRVPADLLWPFTTAQPRPRVPFWAGVNGLNVQLWTAFSAIVLGVTVVVLLRDVWIQLERSRGQSTE